MSNGSPTPFLHITVGDDRTVARFVRPTRLTEETVEAVSREFAALVADRSTTDLVLDLGYVEFLSSIALTQLLGLNRTVRAGSGRLTLTNLRPDIRRVFLVSRLNLVLDIDPRPQAMAS